ncbi:M28 family peptidase [Nitrospira sp. M1]
MSAIDPTSLTLTSDLAHRLQGHVAYLASQELAGRKPGTPGHEAAAHYIVNRFQEAELELLPSLQGYRQHLLPEIGDNLIGIRRAHSSAATNRWLLLGAHYDHLGKSGRHIYRGADDNAAAVAILLEIAKTLPSLTRYSVVFVAFTAEEPPYALMGSQHFVDHLPSEIGSSKNLQTVMILELMGGVHWEPLRQVIFAAGAEQSPELYRHIKHQRRYSLNNQELLIKPLGMHVIEEIPILGRTPFSDYHAFRNASVPFLFLSAGRTPRYHQPTDLPDTLHYERMALTTRWLIDLFHQLNEDREPYAFLPNTIDFAEEIKTLQPLITHAASRNTCIPNTSLASLLKLKADEKWLSKLRTDHISHRDIKRLERASLRMQGLLANFPAAFLL